MKENNRHLKAYHTIPAYSLQDIIETLKKFKDSEEAWDFASELTGISTDSLAEEARNI